ncbi:hypothetical protein C8F01DRAFT_1238455 [Mycena amicta]|nr:hypothetical protein C8F01DRAFT_1238455 [Mycena amicta]
MAFWDRFPNFVYNPTAPLRSEFERLATQQHWSAETKKQEWRTCAQMEFEHHFGAQGNVKPDLAGWQTMMVFCGFAEVFESIKECKEFLRANAHINMFDMIDAKRTGRVLVKHASLKALRKYSTKNKKIYPREKAKENEFLRILLIRMGG